VGEFPDDLEMRVSHETIYLSLFVQARGALRKELTRFLRSKDTTRRPRGHTVMNGQGQLRATLNIRERPAEANDRAVPGHWEGDLLMGKRMHAMATLVERKSRFVMLVALPNGHSADVRRRRARVQDHRASRTAASIAHLGPRPRDGGARALHHRHRCPRLLL
jgi:IS30 family transposase